MPNEVAAMDVKAVCYNHPDRPAKKGCWRCEQFICNDCSTQMFGRSYCRKCASEVAKVSSKQDNTSLLQKEINSPTLAAVIIILTLIILAVEIFVMTR
jgi:hypothetical protein